MTIVHWEDDAEAWDRLVLASEAMPGIWTVEFSLQRDLDIKKSRGADKARLTDHGYEATEITLTGRMISREDWLDWQRVLPLLHPNRPGDPRAPVMIAHPATNLVGIGQMYIARVSSPEFDNGVMTVKVVGFEAAKPKPVAKTKKAAQSDVYRDVATTRPPDALNRFPGYRGPLA